MRILTHYVILLKYKWDDFIRGENVCSPQPLTNIYTQTCMVGRSVRWLRACQALVALVFSNSIENYGVNWYLALIIAFFHSFFPALSLSLSVISPKDSTHRITSAKHWRCMSLVRTLTHSLIHSDMMGDFILWVTPHSRKTTAHGHFFILPFSLSLTLLFSGTYMIIRVRNATCALCVRLHVRLCVFVK